MVGGSGYWVAGTFPLESLNVLTAFKPALEFLLLSDKTYGIFSNALVRFDIIDAKHS